MSRTLALTALILALLPLGTQRACADDPVRLSAGLDQIEAALKAKDATFPLALVVDKPALAPTETLRLLELIETLAKKGSAVVAVCPKLAKPAAGGSAAVALACSGVVFVDGASVSGAEPGWCLNQATIDQLKAKCAKLGGIDPLLAERLCKAEAELHWSSESGYSTTPSKVTLAKAGVAMVIDAPLIDSLGIGAETRSSLEEAVAAVRDGSVTPRTGTVASGSKAAQPKKPANPSKGNPADIQKRLEPKVAEYNEALAELHDLQKKFNRYWTGLDGVWTTQHDSLRDVWYAGSDHTEHPDTRTTCQRLQRDMKAAITTLRTTAADMLRIAKDPEHPAVVRVNSHKEALEKFRDGIQRNRVDLYEKWNKPVLELK
jgi:hypothetical protein